MPKWTDYTIKTTVADNDEIMTLDTAGKANKRLSLSTLSDWVLGKIADKVFEKLQTNNKTILGAINELNSKAVGAFKAVGFADKSTITIKTNSESYSYGTLIVAINQNGSNSLLNFNITPSTNQTIGKVSVIAKDRTTFIVTFPNTYTHGVIIAGGSISKATFTVS